jgi:hypothetical protein
MSLTTEPAGYRVPAVVWCPANYRAPAAVPLIRPFPRDAPPLYVVSRTFIDVFFYKRRTALGVLLSAPSGDLFCTTYKSLLTFPCVSVVASDAYPLAGVSTSGCAVICTDPAHCGSLRHSSSL